MDQQVFLRKSLGLAKLTAAASAAEVLTATQLDKSGFSRTEMA